jgi:hypothetical protein
MDPQTEAILMLGAGTIGAIFILGSNALAFRIQRRFGWTAHDRERQEEV